MALLPLPQSTAVDSHRLDAPILRSTLPVQVKGTFNYALRTLKELSQVANQTSTTVVASIAVLILETAHSVRSCKDECLLLAMQISELVLLFSESDSQAGDMYEPLIDISVLIRTLSEVHDCQKKLTKRGFFIRALEVREVKAALKRHAQDIENAIQIFRTRSSLRMQRSIVRQVKSDAQNTEEFIEQLDVLRHEIEQAGALQTVSQLHILFVPMTISDDLR
ncbi:hypothetical protein SISSUDRAFT_269863 [Sistotremastrum suecicum HHB10207 ss-3]|uniref:Fungal N-terminal domain-containing protein n=1 Tax=Sistotremastrum suecicum HHB10207 ss-3 TaxID=1314776 RepID=A0A165ZRH9_9AGAM|nr:hypothetical protein SISSUDRAFT_269863 [Sistotremastrum suecicum HHB10207 ss-3]